jgi:hypothetical protein
MDSRPDIVGTLHLCLISQHLLSRLTTWQFFLCAGIWQPHQEMLTGKGFAVDLNLVQQKKRAGLAMQVRHCPSRLQPNEIQLYQDVSQYEFKQENWLNLKITKQIMLLIKK